MKRVSAILLGFLLVALATHSFGQACLKVLEEARDAYDNGNIQELEKMLSPCIEDGFDREQRLEAFKILTLAYIFDDQYDKADEYMLKFLKLDPEYEIDPAVDPVEFSRLYETFKTLPVLSLGVTAGVNLTNVQVSERYGVHDPALKSGTYDGGVGYQFGLMFSKYIFKRVSMNMDIMLTGKTFTYRNSMFGFADLVLAESQLYVEVPLTVTVEASYKRWRGYVGGGISGGYMISSAMDPSRVYGDNALPEVTGNDIQLIDGDKSLRQQSTYWLVAEAGIKYKVKRGMLSFDTMYKIGMLNQTDVSNRYANSDLVYQYYYVSDDFKLTNIAFSASYTYSLYNPKKKKEKK